MTISRITVLSLRLILGVIFVYASIDKIIHPSAFAEVIYSYHILPGFLINLTAIYLPWLELTIGILLIAGRFLPGATILSNILLTIFYMALLLNMARGLNIHCGCFDTQAEGNVSNWWYLGRDTIFLIIGISLLFITFRKYKNVNTLEVK